VLLFGDDAGKVRHSFDFYFLVGGCRLLHQVGILLFQQPSSFLHQPRRHIIPENLTDFAPPLKTSFHVQDFRLRLQFLPDREDQGILVEVIGQFELFVVRDAPLCADVFSLLHLD
jgi:hypothetical protein